MTCYPKLSLNLIPASSWWRNARSELGKEKWMIIRRKVYQRANYTCEICGIKNVRLDCNERWEYQGNKQILVGLEAICRMCHLTQHFGYATVIGKQQEAFNHLLKINNWTGQKGAEYVQEKFREWEERSNVDWVLDLGFLDRIC